jgi:hypothetical protein
MRLQDFRRIRIPGSSSPVVDARRSWDHQNNFRIKKGKGVRSPVSLSWGDQAIHKARETRWDEKPEVQRGYFRCLKMGDT